MNGLILDVIVAVVVVLLVIFGVWRGMYKLIYGLVSSIAAVVLAVILASTVATALIEKTTLDDTVFDMLDEPIQGMLPEDLNATDVRITFRMDGTMEVSSGTTTYETIGEYMLTTPYGAMGVLIDSLVSTQTASLVLLPEGEDEDVTLETNLANVLSTVAIVYIIVIGVFILLWILCYVVVRFLMYLLKKLVNKTYIGHFLDKLLGMVIGAALAMVIIWGVLAVIRLLGTYTWIISINEIINSSTLTKILFENNILYNMLVETMNMQETISGLIGSFANTSTGGTEGSEEAANAAMHMLVARFTGKI